MSSRKSWVSWCARSVHSTPVAAARSSSGTSTSVLFCVYTTAYPAPRHTRLTRSNVTYVAACPMCVASYGVMPHTYIRAVLPSTGAASTGPPEAVSWRRNGRAWPGTTGMSGGVHACMLWSLCQAGIQRANAVPFPGRGRAPARRRLPCPDPLDVRRERPGRPTEQPLHLGGRRREMPLGHDLEQAVQIVGHLHRPTGGHQLLPVRRRRQRHVLEIGRASCRERV